jgi:glycosyltransferase involved in cell wall biosynthesis
MTSVVPRRDPEVVRLIFPGGFVGHRKPLAEAVEAFANTSDGRLRLLIKAQVDRKQLKPVLKRAKRDNRIELLLEDQPTAEHYQAFADCDVALAPARWEGLGLPLFEATAFGMPIITNDDPPMNEIAVDALNALLVGSRQDGTARSGIPAMTPDVDDMTDAIERVADDRLRAKLADGAAEMRERRSWSRTLEDLSKLFERAAAVPAGAAGGSARS